MSVFWGLLSDPFQWLSDLQRLGMIRSRLESPGSCFFFVCCFDSRLALLFVDILEFRDLPNSNYEFPACFFSCQKLSSEEFRRWVLYFMYVPILLNNKDAVNFLSCFHLWKSLASGVISSSAFFFNINLPNLMGFFRA